MKRIRQAKLKTTVLGRRGRKRKQSIPLTVQSKSSSSTLSFHPAAPEELPAPSDADSIINPTSSKDYFRKTNKYVNWQNVSGKLFSAFVEGSAMPDGAICIVCAERHEHKLATVRCSECGPCQLFCSDCAAELHRYRNQFHVLDLWQENKFIPLYPDQGVVGYGHECPTKIKKPFTLVDFYDQPYFYQDVAYGTRALKLKSGEELIMPNVIRTVTRSTMIEQYFKHCTEEEFEPLGRSTLFRILNVREASQRKSLQGLDNTAAGGSEAFETMHKLVDTLQDLGADSTWCKEARNGLMSGKRYLKTEYRAHCRVDESNCPDHCRHFALSDPQNKDFQDVCTHEHLGSCDECERLKKTIQSIVDEIESPLISFYSAEQKEYLKYDLNQAQDMVYQWKSHIMRAEHQDRTKQDALNTLQCDTVFIVMDWAMKFIQLRYREKQSEWYGKRGMNWHDWYAVCAILEHVLKTIKESKPDIKQVLLRSDGAGCYHNHSLLAAVVDIGNRVGIKVKRYDFSEPQFGKDVCDRIISPMKGSLHKYCNEGHGKCIPWSQLIVSKQGPTMLKEVEDCGFFPVVPRPIKGNMVTVNERSDDSVDEEALFSCEEPGCNREFSNFNTLQDHIHFGQHDKPRESESVYDNLKRAWVAKFSSLTLESNTVTSEATQIPHSSTDISLAMGWALQKPRTSGSKFSENVKAYLTERFDFGETTGRKADPSQVTADLRKARTNDGRRRFARDEWLTKGQVQGFFSRLSSARRIKPTLQETSKNRNDIEFLEDDIARLEENNRKEMIDDVVDTLGVTHPITYDGYNLCELVKGYFRETRSNGAETPSQHRKYSKTLPVGSVNTKHIFTIWKLDIH
ncbi:hypothetical protein QZH41_007964 [Actinostola sp. cb2023]|nr:hypothetical protein QZH41_007964 [Actinostola sp. cb2023]